MTRRILIATNEPWGTYHLTPLTDAATARDVELVHVVPDLHHATLVPDGPLRVVALDDLLDDPARPSTQADLLVVTGATHWPGEVASALPHLPVVASCLAYMQPTPGEAADALRERIVVVTAASTGDAGAFLVHLDLTPGSVALHVVGSALLDGLTTHVHRPHWSTAVDGRQVLVLTSVTRADATGGAAPGTDLLQYAADALARHGARVRVRLHPREDPALWDQYEVCSRPLLSDSLDGAELVVMIPGTAAPLAVAAGVPVAATAAPGLVVPDHIAAVCGAWLVTAEDVAGWVATGAPTALPPAAVLDHAVGPVGGAARRLLAAWVAAGDRR